MEVATAELANAKTKLANAELDLADSKTKLDNAELELERLLDRPTDQINVPKLNSLEAKVAQLCRTVSEDKATVSDDKATVTADKVRISAIEVRISAIEENIRSLHSSNGKFNIFWFCNSYTHF